MSNKTTIKIDKELSHRLTIVAVLIKKNKELFVNELLEAGIKPFELKIKPLRFS